MARTLNSDEYRVVWAIRGTGQAHIGVQSCRFYYTRLSAGIKSRVASFEDVIDTMARRRIVKVENDEIHLLDPNYDLPLKVQKPLPCKLFPRIESSQDYLPSSQPIARKRK